MSTPREKALEALKDYCVDCDQGQVELFLRDDEDGNEVALTPQQFAEKEGVTYLQGYLDDHPEGSDRGGYVPYVTLEVDGQRVEAFYYEPACEWYSHSG